jgi:hypothetical protein
MNSKWTKDLNVISKILKLLEGSIGETLENVGIDNILLLGLNSSGNKETSHEILSN